MSRRPAIASAPVGERTPARERAEEAIRTAAAAALACLRAGDIAGAEEAIRSPELRSDSHARDARQAARAKMQRCPIFSCVSGAVPRKRG